MRQTGADHRRRETGFTLIELLVVIVIISLVSAITAPVLMGATNRAHKSAIIADGSRLRDAFNAYYLDQGHFPNEWGPGGFDKSTLNPLVSEGYFPNANPFLGKMAGRKVLLYLAPDIGTPDSEYIAIMRAAYDPNVIVVVAQTRIISSAGHFLDGVYLISDGEFKKADELN